MDLSKDVRFWAGLSAAVLPLLLNQLGLDLSVALEWFSTFTGISLCSVAGREKKKP